MQESFEIGQIVALNADPARSGPVIEVLPAVGGSQRYRVFHSPGNVRDYHAEQLHLAADPVPSDDLLEAVAGGRWLEDEVFRARLTAARLEHPQVDNLYALQAARIRYVPFQYKPLLRFLRADRPRLLVADEVGVGKTIEAGLIFKELQARQELGNVLIVCPKALVPKWRAEMRRFDEDFRPLSAENLRYCLKESHLDGAWPAQYARSVVHLELLRMEEHLQGDANGRHRPGLLTLDPAPRFDLVIVDEAHHLRNPGTNSHELASFLCDASEAVLFLSATPVHLGSRNLFSLLGLLRPDMFQEESVFQEMVEPNRHLTQALRHIRSRAPQASWQRDAAAALEIAGSTRWGRSVLSEDARFSDWRRRLNNGAALGDLERVRCLRDLEEVHSLSHVMNRTRRRDIGRFTIREPRTVTVQFTDQQSRLYEELVTFRREALSLEHDPRVVRLLSDTLERQASSCLPGLIPTLDGFLKTGSFSAGAGDEEDEEEVLSQVPAPLVDRARELRGLAAALPDADPKLDQLLGVLREALNGEGPGKVLVFSFFLHTLAYLEDNLRRAGLRVASITGSIPDEERERLRDRFRMPRTEEEAIDVLLSSEVGSEGLDYEFCDRLVNYDIPWNPMRIEQRIGRIDRYGQTSDKVLIFNFITPGTVEERVYFRCFERLGVFRDTVGDLEEVLGEVVEDLARVTLDSTLTPEQAEERAVQVADNAIRLAEEQRRLEEESGSMLGLDEAFVDEVDSVLEEGRFVSAAELRAMVEAFLSEPEIAGKLSPEPSESGLYRLRIGKEGRTHLLQRARALNRQDRPTLTFIRWLETGERHLTLTFDQSTAVEHREVPFVTPVHPLARLAVEHWSGMSDPLCARLRVQDTEVSPGRYIFVCELWETLAVKPEVRLVGFAWDLNEGRTCPRVSSSLVRLLAKASASQTPPADRHAAEEAFANLDSEAYSELQGALSELRERNETLARQKLASLSAYYESRLRRVQAEMEGATDRRIARMKVAEHDRVRSDHESRKAEIENRLEADIVSERVAAGILEVEHGQ